MLLLLLLLLLPLVVATVAGHDQSEKSSVKPADASTSSSSHRVTVIKDKHHGHSDDDDDDDDAGGKEEEEEDDDDDDDDDSDPSAVTGSDDATLSVTETSEPVTTTTTMMMIATTTTVEATTSEPVTDAPTPLPTPLPTAAPTPQPTVVELALDPSVTPLRVLVNALHPFAFQLEDGSWDGFTVELFDTIARANGWSYTLERAVSVVSAVEQLKQDEADLAFGGIAITSQRQAELEFSFPIFEAGLMILVRQEESVSLTSFLFSHTVWTAICLLVLALVLAGHAFWVLEGARNPQLGARYFTAVPRAIWWASTTISTVGYGDIVPLTNAGRLFAMVWMVFGMISVGFLSGTFSSQLTLAKMAKGISGPLDLPGHVVATKLNSTSQHYLERNGITTRSVKFMSTAYDLLADGEVDAIVFDGPALLYYVVREGLKRGFRVLQTPFETQQYGVLCRKVGLAKGIDVPLLQMREDYRYSALLAHWFGRNEEIYKDVEHDRPTDHTLNFFLYGLTGSLFVVAFAIQYMRRHRMIDEKWLAGFDLTPGKPATFQGRRQQLLMMQAAADASSVDDADAHVDTKTSGDADSRPTPTSTQVKNLDILTRRLHLLEEKLDIMLDRLEETARATRANQPGV